VQLSVTGRHVEVPDELKQYAQDKASKLPKYFDRVQAIEIIFGHESDSFSVEIIVNTEGRRLFVARELGSDTFALIDAAVLKLERQLSRHKKKVRNRKHSAAATGSAKRALSRTRRAARARPGRASGNA